MNILAILILSATIRHELDVEDWGDPSNEGYTVVIDINYTLYSTWTSDIGFAGEMYLMPGDFVQVWLTCHGAAEYHLSAFNLDEGEMVAVSREPGDDYIEWVAGYVEPEPVVPGGGGGCGVNAGRAAGAIAVFFVATLMLWLFVRKVTINEGE